MRFLKAQGGTPRRAWHRQTKGAEGDDLAAKIAAGPARGRASLKEGPCDPTAEIALGPRPAQRAQNVWPASLARARNQCGQAVR